MQLTAAWKKRIALFVLVLAAPAFAVVAFEGLVRGGGQAERPTLIERALAAPAAVATKLWFNSGGQHLSAADAPSQQTAPAAPRELRIPVLVYHNVRDKEAAKPPAKRPYEVTPSEFDQQMAYLEQNGYAAVSFADLDAALDGRKTLPQKPVVITLDDARDSQWQNAYPSLLKHHLTATFFVFTNAIGHDKYFTWEQLKEMQGKGMEVQSHTVYHPYLTKADDATLAMEMEKSKAAIEKNLGTSVIAVAYPFGLHDARVDEAAREAGYLLARSLDHLSDVRSAERMNVPGYIVTGDLKRFPEILAGEK